MCSPGKVSLYHHQKGVWAIKTPGRGFVFSSNEKNEQTFIEKNGKLKNANTQK